MNKVPETFKEFSRKHPRVTEAYENLASECHKAGPLSGRDRCLVKLGIAIGSGVEGSVRSQTRKALDAGLTREEIEHSFLLAMTSIGFPSMMAARTWVEDILNGAEAK